MRSCHSSRVNFLRSSPPKKYSCFPVVKLITISLTLSVSFPPSLTHTQQTFYSTSYSLNLNFKVNNQELSPKRKHRRDGYYSRLGGV